MFPYGFPMWCKNFIICMFRCYFHLSWKWWSIISFKYSFPCFLCSRRLNHLPLKQKAFFDSNGTAQYLLKVEYFTTSTFIVLQSHGHQIHLLFFDTSSKIYFSYTHIHTYLPVGPPTSEIIPLKSFMVKCFVSANYLLHF